MESTVGKSIFQSKTMWVNWAVFLLSCAVLVLEAVSQGTIELPVQADGALVALVLSMANVFLRYLTTEPVR